MCCYILFICCCFLVLFVDSEYHVFTFIDTFYALILFNWELWLSLLCESIYVRVRCCVVLLLNNLHSNIDSVKATAAPAGTTQT